MECVSICCHLFTGKQKALHYSQIHTERQSIPFYDPGFAFSTINTGGVVLYLPTEKYSKSCHKANQNTEIKVDKGCWITDGLK